MKPWREQLGVERFLNEPGGWFGMILAGTVVAAAWPAFFGAAIYGLVRRK